MNYYILKVIIRYVKCLKFFVYCVLKYIDYFFMEEILKKLIYFIFDLFDKNENLYDDIISILEYIYQKYIVYIFGEKVEVLERKVFGGDVFINE